MLLHIQCAVSGAHLFPLRLVAQPQHMQTTHKILLVDDDPDLLDMYREILSELPSAPEVRTATSGYRALAMLESDVYRLMVCDLRMPKVDGLQVLSIVRRKFPQIRTLALTSVADEQFRSRAYALGVDIFWHKPATEQEVQMFTACVESLLGPDSESGFRGIQSKSLVDLIQLECISQSSSVLRIINGTLTALMWIQDGEVVDAEAETLRGEEAFRKILGWRAGHFESLPPEPSRPRTIFRSYNALLLESAQALDESRGQTESDNDAPNPAKNALLSELSKVEGMEFVLALNPDSDVPALSRGLENPKSMSLWARQNFERFKALGERLQAGPLTGIGALGPQRNVALATHENRQFCIGWKHSMSCEQMDEMTKKVLALCAS